MIHIQEDELKKAIGFGLGSHGVWTPELQWDLIIEIKKLVLIKDDVAQQDE